MARQRHRRFETKCTGRRGAKAFSGEGVLHTPEFSDAYVSPDGTNIYIFGEDGFSGFGRDNGRATSFGSQTGAIVKFDRIGHFAAIGTDGQVRVVDLQSLNSRFTRDFPTVPPLPIVPHRVDQQTIAFDWEKNKDLFDASNFTEELNLARMSTYLMSREEAARRHLLFGQAVNVNELALSDDGNRLAVASLSWIWVYDIAIERLVGRRFMGSSPHIRTLWFSADGNSVFAVSSDGLAWSWSLLKNELKQIGRGIGEIIAPDNQRIRFGHTAGASASVPGLFEPLTLLDLYKRNPAADGTARPVVRLCDGGVFDNQGLSALLEQGWSVLLVSDASGQMADSDFPANGVLGVPLRANGILQSRVRASQFQGPR